MIKKLNNQNLTDVNGGLIVLGEDNDGELKYFVFDDRLKIELPVELDLYRKHAYGRYYWGDDEGLIDAKNRAQRCGVSDKLIDTRRHKRYRMVDPSLNFTILYKFPNIPELLD